MAKPSKGSRELERLTPNAIVVEINGEEVRVATSKDENSTMNMIMASQMRSLIHKMIKSYKDKDATLTPKELADLAKAARDVATFSSEVYGAAEPISTSDKKPDSKSKDDIGAIDLSSISNVTPNEVRQDNKDTGAGPGGPGKELEGKNPAST